MIKTKEDLKEYLRADAQANRRSSVRGNMFGDEIWKFQVVLRKYEYYLNQKRSVFSALPLLWYKTAYHRKSVRLGFTIGANVFGKGLSIAHRGTIVVSNHARVGENCRIQEGVNIGSTNGSQKAPVIGNHVFIGTGAKLIGDIQIADDVAIGANAVVVKSIPECGTTWAGVPARKISDHDSHANLCDRLFP